MSASGPVAATGIPVSATTSAPDTTPAAAAAAQAAVRAPAEAVKSKDEAAKAEKDRKRLWEAAAGGNAAVVRKLLLNSDALGFLLGADKARTAPSYRSD